MFFQGAIFDLDNTLYNHKISEKKAYKEIEKYLQNKYNITNVENYLFRIKQNLKYEINNTASSHNRFIYFKKLIEELNLEYDEVEKLNIIYWDIFLNNIILYPKIIEFFEFLKKIKIKIIILTNFQTEYQFKKLNKLKILNFCDYIITSEEVGIEKPSLKIFNEVVRITGIERDKLIMLGDDFKNDINGAINSKIYSFFYGGKKFEDINYKYSSYTNIEQIYNFFYNFDKELHNFVKLCNFVGKRFDLVQGGGGNISFKIKNLLVIKSSGINMDTIKYNKGYSILNNKEILKDINNNNFKPVSNYNIFNNSRASIETYMHSILKKYTLHIHPIGALNLLVRKNINHIAKEYFPEVLLINYKTPGVELCKEIMQRNYERYKIFFLINHGLIITSDNLKEIYEILNKITIKTEKLSGLDLTKYKEDYVCEDMYINKYLNLLNDKFYFPDSVVFLKDKYYIKCNTLFIKAKNFIEFKNIENLLKANLLIINNDEEKINLDDKEIKFLNNWEAEKYRLK